MHATSGDKANDGARAGGGQDERRRRSRSGSGRRRAAAAATRRRRGEAPRRPRPAADWRKPARATPAPARPGAGPERLRRASDRCSGLRRHWRRELHRMPAWPRQRRPRRCPWQGIDEAGSPAVPASRRSAEPTSIRRREPPCRHAPKPRSGQKASPSMAIHALRRRRAADGGRGGRKGMGRVGKRWSNASAMPAPRQPVAPARTLTPVKRRHVAAAPALPTGGGARSGTGRSGERAEDRTLHPPEPPVIRSISLRLVR